jgi:transcriptional regulator GlxA family with amidase domain
MKGISPARYLAQAKLRHAASLLRETRLSVAAIAAQCGFGSKQSLIRWMRRELKCLPSELRRE